MEFRDYYKVLGVSRDADEKAIKSAYHKLARKYHPDVNKADPQAEEKFKEINEAYEVLKDPEKRQKYDRWGKDWERYRDAETSGATTGAGANWTDFSDWFSGNRRTTTQGEQQTSTGSFSDFFETLFGDTIGRTSGRRRTQPQPQRGQDYEHPIQVKLREAYNGTKRNIDVQIEERCPTCGGTGVNGTGVCPNCFGSGRVERKKTLEVKIPAGVHDGSRVRMAGQGSPGVAGGPAGDIYLLIHVAPDPRFEIDGQNLRTEVEVPLYTALLGGEVPVQAIDRQVSLTIPPETQNGQLFRLRGLGMPSLKGGKKGDLLAKVKVVLPSKLGSEERELFERLREA